MIFYIFLLVVTVLILLSKCKPEPLHGVYEQPGYLAPLKHVLIYLVIRLNKRRVSHKAVGHEKAWLGLAAEDDVSIMESPRPLLDHPLACDAVWFGGGSRDGTYLVMSGARRQNNILQSMVFVYIPGVGLLRHIHHPETGMRQTGEDREGWSGGGVSLVPEIPMKKWKLRFEGRMKNLKTKTEHNVKIRAEYLSSLPYFDFDSEMNPWTVARAMAREPWSREYFTRLKAAHQNHYEQFGDVRGVVQVDDDEHSLDVQVMKDHTHGSIRDWTLLHRYCFHQFNTVR